MDTAKDWGISEPAWDKIAAKRVTPLMVFCHPDKIQQNPRLITYYRCLALLPQKGMQRLAVGTQSLEEGKSKSLSSTRALKIAHAVNSLLSLLIESDPNWTLEGAQTAALLNLGSQINGAWRNEIGAEGSRRVKELLVESFLSMGLVKETLCNDGTIIDPTKALPSFATLKGFTAVNGFSLTFGSEPDVSIRDPKGMLVATIEVKYGLDPAGALERYGAAKKSFEQAKKENAAALNVYLASCITDEVSKRIEEDQLVYQSSNLTEILGDPDKREELIKFVKWLLHL